METRKGDIKISGSGKASGGVYDQVKISGSGIIDGDIECNVFSTSGSSSVKGNLKAEIIKTSGASKIEGDINCREVKISGGSSITGNLKADKIVLSGGIKVGGNIEGENITLSGVLKIDGDCECEYFKSNGGFKINGLLNSETIEITTGGKCKVKEIGGQTIRIERGMYRGLDKIIKSIFGEKYCLVTDVIEGDEIYIEDTIAQIVRGNNVNIGPGCDIQVVEYRNNIKVNDNSKVTETNQV